MNEILFVDSAYPPSQLYGAQGQCFYAGGDTPHVWLPSEVFALGARFLLPIWVRSNPAAALAEPDSALFINRLLTVYRAPKGILTALDSETSADPAYVIPFVNALNAAGYPVIDYGSQSTVFGNQNPDGYYWGADWTGIAHIASGDQMTQFRSLAAYDLSEAQSTLPFWNTRPVSQPPVNLKGKNMYIIKVTNYTAQYLLMNGVMRHIVSTADLAAFLQAGIVSITVSAEQFAELSGGMVP